MSTYRDRLEAEAMNGHPALPCPHCGYDAWAVEQPWRKSRSYRPCLAVAVCSHCHVVETAHHVDGEWMGMHMYSGLCGPLTASLCDFVTEHAAFLREKGTAA